MSRRMTVSCQWLGLHLDVAVIAKSRNANPDSHCRNVDLYSLALLHVCAIVLQTDSRIS